MSQATSILKHCLLESTLNEIREIENLDYSFITADEDFKERIKNDVKKSRSFFKSKKLFLILVAVLATLCLMMSISAIRTPIIDFFVETYDNFSSLFVKSEEPSTVPTTIEVEYQPSYFEKNGYEILNQTKSRLGIFTIWSRDNIKLEFSQMIATGGFNNIDTEDASYDTTYIGPLKVFYTKKYGIYSVRWIQDGYFFMLHCCPGMDLDDVEEIILSTGPLTP